ncbi:unnamed protein product [Diamesa tonsa]
MKAFGCKVDKTVDVAKSTTAEPLRTDDLSDIFENSTRNCDDEEFQGLLKMGTDIVSIIIFDEVTTEELSTSNIHSTPQMNFLQKQKELREQPRSESQNRQQPPPHSGTGGFYEKPPAPPPKTIMLITKIDAQIRQKSLNGNGKFFMN